MIKSYIDLDCEKFIHESRKIEQSYIEACEWISSFGVPYEKTRFGVYEKDLINSLSRKDSSDGKDSISIFMNAHKEATELVRIMNVYKSFDPDEIIKPIQIMTSGQRFRNATKKDQSRDFAFELGVASRFIKAGFQVDLRSISDLVVNIQGTTLYVECKRLKSLSQLAKRTKVANDQIKTRLSTDNSSKSRGLIALNVTDIVMDSNDPLLFPTVEDYQETSAQTLKNFVFSNKDMFMSKRVKKCLGVFTEFTTQAIILPKDSSEMAFANIREGNIFQYPLSASETDFMDSFLTSLGNQDV